VIEVALIAVFFVVMIYDVGRRFRCPVCRSTSICDDHCPMRGCR